MLKCLGIVVAALFVSGASQPPASSGGNSQSDGQAHAAHNHTDTQDAGRDTQSAPLVVQIQQAPNQRPIATETKNEGDWYARPDWWIVAFTCGLLIVTTALAIVTALLWRATREAVKDANEGVRIARDTLKHANDVSNIELRPWLSIQDVQVTLGPPLEVDVQMLVPTKIAFNIVNSGATPAIGVMAGIIPLHDDHFPDTRANVGSKFDQFSTEAGAIPGAMVAPDEIQPNLLPYSVESSRRVPRDRVDSFAMLLGISVTYRSVGGDEAWQTAQMYRVGQGVGLSVHAIPMETLRAGPVECGVCPEHDFSRMT